MCFFCVDRRQEEDDYRVNEMREQVLNLRQELESNSDAYESLMEKYKDLLKVFRFIKLYNV